jgi:outer membrane protein assembly factor BamB
MLRFQFQFLWPVAVAVGLLPFSFDAIAGDRWTRFRGPAGDGHAEASNLPETWSETENIAWKAEVPGKGWSSPVVGDGMVWMTTATVKELDDAEIARIKKKKLAANPVASQMEIVGPAKLFVVGVDLATGELRKTYPLFDIAEPDPIHSLNSYASPSPTLHEGRLYCHFGKFGTACIDTKTGRVLWSRQFVIDHAVGPGSSPVLHDGVLIIPCDGMDRQFIVGLDAATGKDLWRTDRPPLSGDLGDMHKAFATPLVVQRDGSDQAIVPGAQWFAAYDPRTGRELWRFRHGTGFSNVPAPVTHGDLAFLCTGFTKPELCAVRLGGSGDITDSHLAWRYSRQVPSMSSPLVVRDQLYFVSDQGVLTCLDVASGKQLWQERLKGNFSASPLYADGKAYISSRDGETTVFRPGSNYDEVAVNVLSGQLMASPVVLDNVLLLRSDTHLYRIQVKPPAAPSTATLNPTISASE